MEYLYEINGEQVKLAEKATPKRITEFCRIFGKTNMSELLVPKDSIDGSAKKMSGLLLDAIGDSSLTQRILNCCTEKTFTIEEAGEADAEITGRIATDFFLQLIVKFFRQQKL